MLGAVGCDVGAGAIVAKADGVWAEARGDANVTDRHRTPSKAAARRRITKPSNDPGTTTIPQRGGPLPWTALLSVFG
jgi:hypothetical protein